MHAAFDVKRWSKIPLWRVILQVQYKRESIILQKEYRLSFFTNLEVLHVTVEFSARTRGYIESVVPCTSALLTKQRQDGRKHKPSLYNLEKNRENQKLFSPVVNAFCLLCSCDKKPCRVLEMKRMSDLINSPKSQWIENGITLIPRGNLAEFK